MSLSLPLRVTKSLPKWSDFKGLCSQPPKPHILSIFFFSLLIAFNLLQASAQKDIVRAAIIVNFIDYKSTYNDNYRL